MSDQFSFNDDVYNLNVDSVEWEEMRWVGDRE